LEIPQGSKINIQGLDCNIPPVGYVWNLLTKKLEYRGIYSRSNNTEEQYWERIYPPLWYREVMKAWDLYDKKKKEELAEKRQKLLDITEPLKIFEVQKLNCPKTLSKIKELGTFMK